jgi:hypothetical protein
MITRMRLALALVLVPALTPGGPHKYETFAVIACSRNTTATGVVWDAVYCDVPVKTQKYPDCCGGIVVKTPTTR